MRRIELTMMQLNIKNLLFTVLIVLITSSASAKADEILIAVASNFKSPIAEIARKFEEETNHKVTLIYGSTGRHYAQIKNGAPFDAFFSADSHRPELLEKEGLIVPGSRFTYALGKVVLWSPQDDLIDQNGSVLSHGRFKRIAMAHPKLAPYGKAAYEVLSNKGVWDAVKTKVVRGENIGQTFQFVKSANAQLGFVAYSQLKQMNDTITGTYWDIPQSLYSQITQQAVILKNNQATRDFISMMKSASSHSIIHRFGYGTEP
ncbi:molybdate ABC transporter substrate-binding protein [Cocleimonas flava]|nr:molybdate ABC transporter substrate-binding protein [Cocleimonas flava]